MPKILFVCTGNIFRSMSAEYALKSIAPPGVEVASAGTETWPDRHLRKDVRARVSSWGVDCGAHSSRQITREILDDADLVVAMSTDHKEWLMKNFGYDAPLFLEVCTGKQEAFPDLWEVVPDYRSNRDASVAYVNQAVDLIFSQRENFLRNMPAFLNQPQTPPPQRDLPRPPKPPAP